MLLFFDICIYFAAFGLNGTGVAKLLKVPGPEKQQVPLLDERDELLAFPGPRVWMEKICCLKDVLVLLVIFFHGITSFPIRAKSKFKIRKKPIYVGRTGPVAFEEGDGWGLLKLGWCCGLEHCWAGALFSAPW